MLLLWSQEVQHNVQSPGMHPARFPYLPLHESSQEEEEEDREEIDREETKERYNIERGHCDDAMSSVCCTSCVICVACLLFSSYKIHNIII